MEILFKKMTVLKEDFESLFNLIKETKEILSKLNRYKGNATYKKAFLGKVAQLNRLNKFLLAKIAKESNPAIKKAFKKIEGNIETITEYKNPESSLEKVSYIEEHWPDIEIALEESTEFTERVYDKGSRFDFHLDIKEIIKKAKKNILIIDPFIDEHLLEITLKDIDKGVDVRILTNSRNADKRGKFTKLANMFKTQQKGGFETRETEEIHDRGIFINDKDGWVMGQSIKDGAKKPTYLIKLQEPKKLKGIYEQTWNISKRVI